MSKVIFLFQTNEPLTGISAVSCMTPESGMQLDHLLISECIPNT